MFKTARIKLTATYVLIMMLVTISFSTLVYIGVNRATRETLARREQMEKLGERFPNAVQKPGPRHLNDINEETVAEIQQNLLYNLIYINVAIATLTAGLGYVLTGYTLKPIQKMVEDQDRFVSDAAHELKTPLAAMKTELEVTLRDKNLDIKTARKIMESSIEEVNKLKNLAESLLSESRTRKNNFEKEIVNIKDQAEKALKKVSKLAKDKNIEFVTDILDVDIKSTPELIEQMMVIFLDNAIKYSEDNSKIIVKIYKNKSQAVIKIEDFGIGISEKDIPNIFKRFYRADTSRTKQKTSGFGLGLSIAKNIIDQNKGSVKVESTLSKGTTFIIKFPLA